MTQKINPNQRLHVRVKTAKGRKLSSTRWLERQLNDPYVHAASVAGYRSRAAFKLIEIDDRFKLLKRGARVIDLGCAPGGWSQIAAERVNAPESGHVIAIDIAPMPTLAECDFYQLDFLDDNAPAQIITHLGASADVVLSDMAAPVTGHRATDRLRTTNLAIVAAEFATQVLKPGGAFCAKIFQGGSDHDLLTHLRTHFCKIAHLKPRASRKESVELYVIAQEFRTSEA